MYNSTRSVNTFQHPETSSANLRRLKANSLYLPTNYEQDESPGNLLNEADDPMCRRTQTLGRTQPHKTGQRNPLFESMGSIEQPWFPNFPQTTVRLSPPEQDEVQQNTMPPPSLTGYSENNMFATTRETQPLMRAPLHRGTGRGSSYSGSGYHTKASSYREMRPARQSRQSCMPCCEKETNPYSLPEFTDANDDRFHRKTSQATKPWVVCLLTVSTILDIFLLTILTAVVFFLNCSSDSWLYSDRRIQAICTNLWADWIPLHQRNFRCPALPPGVEDQITDGSFTRTHEFVNRYNPNPDVPFGQTDRLNAIVQDSRRTASKVKPLIEPESWDADMGLMPPPKIRPFGDGSSYGVSTSGGFGSSFEHDRYSQWWKDKDLWYKLNPVSPYSLIATESVIVGCLLIPVVTIIVIEITAGCLSCCCWPVYRKRQGRFRQLKHVIGRLYRLTVTYIFGLLTVILIVCILKSAVGRLRPNFITICRPVKSVCPHWASVLQANGYQYYTTDGREERPVDQSILQYLARESERQGFVLVPRTTTPNPLLSETKSDRSLLSNTDCAERRILRLKYARTSFPSLTAAVTMYATIFTSAYITYTLRYLRRTCFCIPLSLLLGGCLANVLLGLGRVVHRKNWLEDVIAGWVLGVIIASYGLYRALHSARSRKDVTNEDIQKQLNQLQDLIQCNADYRQHEIKFMKYL